MTEITKAVFSNYLKDVLPNNVCRKCGWSKFNLLMTGKLPSMLKLSGSSKYDDGPEEAPEYFDMLAYHCVKCGSVEFIVYDVVADWVATKAKDSIDG